MNEGGRMNIKVVSATLGIVWSLYLLGISVIAMVSDVYAHNVVEFIVTVYPGYSLSFMGVIYGMLWAFLDGAIFGLVFSFIYNQVLKCPCFK